MDNNTIEDILNDEEKAVWNKMQAKLAQSLEDMYKENIQKLADSVSSGTKYLEDPIRPKHITTAPREIVIGLNAEISTVNEKNQLEDIARLFDHYYHIPVPANVDYKTDLVKFLEQIDDSVKDYAKKIK